MGELAQAVKGLLSGNLPTCIQKCIIKGAKWEGKFYLVGSIPYELTQERNSGYFKSRESICFETEQEAIDALKLAGVKRFQLADCSWYEV